MSRSLRPLLPAGRGQQNSSDSSPTPQVPKRTASKAACEACRRRKSKCTAERPRCAICVERQTACEYKTLPTETHLTAQKRRLTDLQAKCDAYEELCTILRSRQGPDTDIVLRRIRAGDDIAAIVKTMQAGDLLLQLRLRAPDRFRYEFPYIREMPPTLEGDSWSNPYLGSTLHQKALIYPSPRQSPAADLETIMSEESQRMFLVPYHTAEMADPKLDSADVAKWTTVSPDNSLLRRLLKIYFIFEFPFHPFFHKDLFLDDLLSGDLRFCSPLLVNAVLAAAWHGNSEFKSRAAHWHPDNMGYRFYAEAKRLLELDHGSPKITTVQAAAILNSVCNINGTDELGWPFLRKSLSMAQQLDLFVHSPESSRLWQIVAGTTAWSLFNWQAAVCYHNFRPPLVSEAPTCPLPDPDVEPDYYGDVRIKFPGSDSATSISNGAVFKAVSKFRKIMNEVAQKSFKEPQSSTYITLSDAYEAYEKLQTWYQQLPDVLTPDRIALPSHLKLHMHFHILIVGLFEPYAHIEPANNQPTPELIVAKSKACFETLVRIYYLRHGFESYDTTLLQFLPLLAFSTLGVLRNTDSKELDPEKRKSLISTLVLCAKGIWEQGRNYYGSEAVFHLLQGSLRPEDSELSDILKREVASCDDEVDRMAIMIREVRSHWPIGVYSATQEPVDHSLHDFIRWVEPQAIKGKGKSTDTNHFQLTANGGWVSL
ncbi:hypothetical protein PG999_002250 [Apiospora kogelbergensis]|uniref:Zn(2)-C6 fungal-type domain-containing protein n=1 Tax=Apiospora kogelbergensis TaxID=1337665 RepID=A0AAW0R7U3_9PEZI